MMDICAKSDKFDDSLRHVIGLYSLITLDSVSVKRMWNYSEGVRYNHVCEDVPIFLSFGMLYVFMALLDVII